MKRNGIYSSIVACLLALAACETPSGGGSGGPGQLNPGDSAGSTGAGAADATATDSGDGSTADPSDSSEPASSGVPDAAVVADTAAATDTGSSADAGSLPLGCEIDADCTDAPGTGACAVGKCKASSKTCVVVDAAFGKPCDDGDACTTDTECTSGACGGGSVLSCDDSDACTDDSCEPGAGCVQVPNQAPCDDGDPCTSMDGCANGACVGSAMACDDGDPCTNDLCSEGECQYEPSTAPCDDGDPCTIGDVCAGGACTPGGPKPCSGDGGCSVDWCDAETGECKHQAGCLADQICDETLGACVSTCAPSCDGKTCGDDGCGGSCGACNAGTQCKDGACVQACPQGAPTAVITIEEGEEAIPQTVLHLFGDQSFAAAGITKWAWSVAQPVGSQSLFNPSDAFPNPTFEANVAGTYAFALTVWDSNGAVSCSPAVAEVVVIPDEAIHIELLWNTPGDADQTDEGPEAGADVDIHFLHQNASGPDLDGDGAPDGWFDKSFDCFWFNPWPQWGSFDPGVDDDPGLDRDDTDGAGPENLNLNIPEQDNQYRVGVHYWNDHDYGPSYVTVRIYIYSDLVFELTDVKLLHHDMWEAATIDWPSAKVTTVTDDTGNYKITPNYENPFFFVQP